MATCCIFLSVRTGCLLGSLTFLIIGIIKGIMLIFYPLPEGPQTIVILNIVLLLLACVVLLIGVLTEDRVCIITFICFDICGMMIQNAGLLAYYIILEKEIIASWLLVILVVEQGPFVYMIPIGVMEYRIVKEKHMHCYVDDTRTGVKFEHSSHVPTLGY